MNNLLFFLLESCCLALSTGLLITIYGLRHAPLGFQQGNLFYYGAPPTGIIPVEAGDSSPHQVDWL